MSNAKKSNKGYCIFAFGAKTMKGISKRSIEAALMKIVKEANQDLQYVVVGTVRDTDKAVYSVCRKKHLPVASVPSDFEKFSISAEHIRNGLALKFFKPKHVLVMHTDPEEESVVKSLLTWAKNHDADVTMLPPKKVEVKKK